MITIPVIDISPFEAGGPGAGVVVDAVRAAARDTGSSWQRVTASGPHARSTGSSWWRVTASRPHARSTGSSWWRVTASRPKSMGISTGPAEPSSAGPSGEIGLVAVRQLLPGHRHRTRARPVQDPAARCGSPHGPVELLAQHLSCSWWSSRSSTPATPPRWWARGGAGSSCEVQVGMHSMRAS